MARVWAWLAAVAAALVVAPAAAWAWQEPQDKDLGTVTATKGDTVRFELEGTDQGATWRATLNGAELASGTDETPEPGAEGSFQVPDLGTDPHEADVTIAVEHEGKGGDWDLRLTLDYRPPAPATTPPPPPKQAPPPSAPPPATSTRDAPPAPVVTIPARPVTAPATLVVDRGRRHARSPVAPAKRVVRRLVARLTHPRHKHASKHARKKAKRHAKRARKKADRARRLAPAEPIRRDFPPAPDTRVDLSGDGFAGFGYTVAWKLLAAVALGGALLALMLGTLARVRRRRREAEVEAALQEMVAEGRADARPTGLR